MLTSDQRGDVRRTRAVLEFLTPKEVFTKLLNDNVSKTS